VLNAMTRPLMPKATAMWLIENTTLTFEQIAEFCGLHMLEVQAMADDEVAMGMQGRDPVMAGELTAEEIERCAKDPASRLRAAVSRAASLETKAKGARYVPVAKRQDRPDAIAWLLKNYPELSDGQVCKLINTTKPTIDKIRDRTHWNSANIKARNPVGLGLCREADLQKEVDLARARQGSVRSTQE
jgi:hypothetical protein